MGAAVSSLAIEDGQEEKDEERDEREVEREESNEQDTSASNFVFALFPACKYDKRLKIRDQARKRE